MRHRERGPLPNRTTGPRHPGLFLKEELQCRGWTVEYACQVSLITVEWLERFMAGEVDVDPYHAIGLAELIGTTERYWLRLQYFHDTFGKEPND